MAELDSNQFNGKQNGEYELQLPPERHPDNEATCSERVQKNGRRTSNGKTCQCQLPGCLHNSTTCQIGFPDPRRVLCPHCTNYRKTLTTRKYHEKTKQLIIAQKTQLEENKADLVREQQRSEGLTATAASLQQHKAEQDDRYNKLTAKYHSSAQRQRVFAQQGAVDAVFNSDVVIRTDLVELMHNKPARELTSTAKADGWDVIAGNRKTLAVPNPPELPGPEVEEQRAFGCFERLPEEQRGLVHLWCMGAAQWSKEKLPFLRDIYIHAFVLLYQHGDSPAQPPHIDISPGQYQGSVTITEGPCTELFQPPSSPTAESVARQMGMTLEDVMRNHPDIIGMRDLLLRPTADNFHGAFSPQQGDAFEAQPGDACLFEGGIVHRGPACKLSKKRNAPGRLSFGRLILFWVVSPLGTMDQYDSNTQLWMGDLEMQMAVETENDVCRQKLEEYAAAACHQWHDSYPHPVTPLTRLMELYTIDEKETDQKLIEKMKKKRAKAAEVVKGVTLKLYKLKLALKAGKQLKRQLKGECKVPRKQLAIKAAGESSA